MERLPIDWAGEKSFQCNSILYLEIILNHSCNSPFPVTPVFVKRASVSYHDFLSIYVHRIRHLAIPELSSVLPSREYNKFERLEVLSLS